MSRYLILLILTLPFILASLIGALTQYKMQRISKRKYWWQVLLWTFILIGLIMAEPLYRWLFDNQLTDTEPLSLFDVIQITAIVIVFYIANRTRAKLERIEKRLEDLHRELSISLSGNGHKD